MPSPSELRDLHDHEMQMLTQLLDVDFPGKRELVKQLSRCRVTQVDEEGSLRFSIEDSPSAKVRERIPVEAEYIDADGVVVHILIHVVDGKLRELEIYKDDSSPIVVQPQASELTVWAKNL